MVVRGRADHSESPDAGGSCIDVPTAVAGWKKHMEPLSNFNSAMYLGSPAVTNAAASDTTGLGWLAKFMEACDGCTIDFINIHWYATHLLPFPLQLALPPPTPTLTNPPQVKLHPQLRAKLQRPHRQRAQSRQRPPHLGHRVPRRRYRRRDQGLPRRRHAVDG